MKLKSNVLVTVTATALCFLSVVYMSCRKNDTFPCKNIVCYNGGACSSGVCVCPYGYQDDSCGHTFSAKFIGTWNVTQKIIGSSIINGTDTITNTAVIGTDSTYTDSTSLASTPTAFFVQSWLGNKGYTNLTCAIDTTTTNFAITTYTPITNPGYTVMSGYGSIDTATKAITGEYYDMSIHSGGGNVYDTVSYTMTLIKAY